MRCAACNGTAHPATGCQYTPTMLVCGPCVRRFWAWARVHTNAMKRVGQTKKFVSFYEAARREPS